MPTPFYDRQRDRWRVRFHTETGHTSRSFKTEAEARAFDPANDTGPRRPGPAAPRTPEAMRQRIYRAVVIDVNGCWIWQPKGSLHGYGQFLLRPEPGAKPKGVLAHRASYEAFVGPIPQGLQIDHLCFVPKCVNPAHLEPVTGAENLRRRDARKQVSA